MFFSFERVVCLSWPIWQTCRAGAELRNGKTFKRRFLKCLLKNSLVRKLLDNSIYNIPINFIITKKYNTYAGGFLSQLNRCKTNIRRFHLLRNIFISFFEPKYLSVVNRFSTPFTFRLLETTHPIEFLDSKMTTH